MKLAPPRVGHSTSCPRTWAVIADVAQSEMAAEAWRPMPCPVPHQNRSATLRIDVAVDIHLHEVHVAESRAECCEMRDEYTKCSVRDCCRGPLLEDSEPSRPIGIGPETVMQHPGSLSDSAATVRPSSTMRSWEEGSTAMMPETMIIFRVCQRPTSSQVLTGVQRYALLSRDFLKADPASREAWGYVKKELAAAAPTLADYRSIKTPADRCPDGPCQTMGCGKKVDSPKP